MIKGITFARHINEAAEYERLASFFAELGVEFCLEQSSISKT